MGLLRMLKYVLARKMRRSSPGKRNPLPRMPTTPSLRGPDRPSRRDRLRDESRNRNCNRMPRRNVNRNAVNRSNTNRNGLQSSPRNRCCQPTASTKRVTSSAISKSTN